MALRSSIIHKFVDLSKKFPVLSQKAFIDQCQEFGAKNNHEAESIQKQYRDMFPISQDKVFINPELFGDFMKVAKGKTPFSIKEINSSVANLMKEIDFIEREMQSRGLTEETFDELQEKVHKELLMKSSLGFGGLLSGVGFYWYLVYVAASWDLMEPVTYFTGSAFLCLGFYWWQATHSEFEYANIKDYFSQKATKKFSKQMDFNVDDYRSMVADLNKKHVKVKELVELLHEDPAIASTLWRLNEGLYEE
eukprot:TRINITY_DN778370_c0_g1_i1.p1 TRINITY_DN778370_c0_g1~~TRINITY_DN778370_c0_g1_i1.p1  ORF type:complete len:250 (+),score=68.14 TRINITY_DN778370_c0_g1_i1:69-818(+)